MAVASGQVAALPGMSLSAYDAQGRPSQAVAACAATRGQYDPIHEANA